VSLKPLVLVEGIYLSQILQAIDQKPNSLLWLETEGGRVRSFEKPTAD